MGVGEEKKRERNFAGPVEGVRRKGATCFGQFLLWPFFCCTLGPWGGEGRGGKDVWGGVREEGVILAQGHFGSRQVVVFFFFRSLARRRTMLRWGWLPAPMDGSRSFVDPVLLL